MNAKDLAEYCAASIPAFGVVGETIFYSFLPDSPDQCMVIYDTGGWAKDPDFPRTDPTFQIVFRALDYDEAQALIQLFSSWFMPEGIPRKCFTIGSDFVHLAQPMQAAPFYLERDENNRDKFVWNFTFIIH